MRKKEKQIIEVEIPLDEILDDRGIKFRENSTEQLILDECPNCKSKRKMYVDNNTGAFICFKCEFKDAHPIKLLQKLFGIKEHEAIRMVLKEDSKIARLSSEKDALNLLSKLKTPKKRKTNKPTPPIDMPKLSRDLKKTDKKAWSYLQGRGYTDDIINKLGLKIIPFAPQSDFGKGWNYFKEKLELNKEDLGEGTSRDKLTDLQKKNRDELMIHISGAGRIFFPIYVYGNIHGYLARDYTEGILKKIAHNTNGKSDYIKVLNTKGVEFRSHYVWNFDNAKESETLVIAEGATSAIKCGIDRSIALMGKMATSGQLKLLKQTKAKKIVLCLDVGTEKEQRKLYEKLMFSYPKKIFVVNLPNHYLFDEEINNDELNRIKKWIKGDVKVLDKNLMEISPNVIKYLTDLKNGKIKRRDCSEEDKVFLKSWLKKGDFKDPGDYSFEEMENFIKRAKLMK